MHVILITEDFFEKNYSWLRIFMEDYVKRSYRHCEEEIRRELGKQDWCDMDYIKEQIEDISIYPWLFLDDDMIPFGFAILELANSRVYLKNAYILPEYKHKKRDIADFVIDFVQRHKAKELYAIVENRNIGEKILNKFDMRFAGYLYKLDVEV